MEWPDCLVDKPLTDQELVSALSRYLLVEPSTILIVNEVPSAKLPSMTTIMCERYEIRGEFVLKLSFYPQNDSVQARDGCQFVEFLSATKNCRCLLPDKSDNPYSMILVEGTNHCKEVLLDVDGLDRVPEEYVINRERS